MKSIGDILKSSDFKREVSLLLFFFAGLNLLFSAIIFIGRSSDPLAMVGIVSFIQALIYFVFGLLIRRGSTVALLAFAILFTLDTLLIFFVQLEQTAVQLLLGRGLLIFLLIRYVRKQRLMSI